MNQQWSDARAGDRTSSDGRAQERTANSGAEPARLDVSVPQVAGGAMASVTAAYLGSYLGVAGTFWGAGLTSVVITVGGALYQRSLERTTDKASAAAAKAAVKRAANKPLGGAVARRPADPAREATRVFRPPSGSSPSGMHWPGGEQVVDEPGDLRSGVRRCAQRPHSGEQPDARDRPGSRERPGSRDRRCSGVDQQSRTRVLRWDGTRYASSVEYGSSVESGPGTAAVGSAISSGAATSPDVGTSPDAGKFPAPRRRVRWAALAATGALMFGLCMLVVTGFEGLTGKPMSGGDGGTTVGSVFRSGPQRPEPAPAVPGAPETSGPSSPIRPSEQLEPSKRPGSGQLPGAGEPSTSPRPSGTRVPTTTERPTGEPAPGVDSPTTGRDAPTGGGERTGTGTPEAEPKIEPEIADQTDSSGSGQR